MTLAIGLGLLASHAAAPGGAMRSPTLFGLNVPTLGALDASTAAIGARAALVGTFADWAHAPDFPHETAARINARGAVPVISWEPWDSWRGGADQPRYALAHIAAGDHDALIDRWAVQVARYHRPVMLRFAAEMNGDWLPWSTGVNGNGPGDYVAAWRHVRARFARAGALNAIWVCNPIAHYDGATPLRAVFPGRRDVDWTAVDGYNWGAARDRGWQDYDDVLAPTLRALRRLSPGSPRMIAETGSAPDPRKAAWVRDTLSRARAEEVAAVVWFEFEKETDWRLSESPAAAAAARDVVRSGSWLRGGDLAAVERAVKSR